MQAMTVHLINNNAVTAAAARAGQALAPAAVGQKRKPPKDPTGAKRQADWRARKRAAVTDDGVPTVTEPVTPVTGAVTTVTPAVTDPVTTVTPEPRKAPSHAASASVTADPALMGVLALIEGLRAGQAEIDRIKHEARQAAAEAKAERRQESRTKAIAFVIYYAMAAVLGYAAWAGING
jgi:hypothetical protein